MRVELNNNNNDDNKMKNCKMVFYNFNTFPIVINTQIYLITPTFLPQFSFGVVKIEIGNELKVKIGFFKCM